MKPKCNAKRLSPMKVCLILVLVTLSCNLLSPDRTEEPADLEVTSTATMTTETQTLSPTEPMVASPEPSATVTMEVVQGPTMIPFAPHADPQTPLTKEGPWLVYIAGPDPGSPGQGIGALIVNVDGSGRSRMANGLFPSSIGISSPSEDRFAYILQASDTDDQVPHLIVRRVPGGEAEKDVSLISREVLETVSGQEGLHDQIMMAVSGVDSFAWSPQGHYLAFTAALNGPHADLYRFDTWSNNIRRLTEGPYHAYQPVWSPDGDWIIYQQVESFGDGEEWQVVSMAAVDFDGTIAKHLYLTGGIRQSIVQWLDNRHFIVCELTNSGARNLMKAGDADTTPRALYQGPISDPAGVSFDDLLSVAAFVLREEDIRAEDGLQAGIYFYGLDEGDWDLVLPGTWRSVEWWQGKGVFIANGEQGTAFIRRTGEVVKQIDVTDPVSLSPDGQWIVSYGEEGAIVYTHIGVLINEALEGAAVSQVIWQPDSAGFFLEVYLQENPSNSHHLYSFNLEKWDLQWVDGDFRGNAFWTGPALASPEARVE